MGHIQMDPDRIQEALTSIVHPFTCTYMYKFIYTHTYTLCSGICLIYVNCHFHYIHTYTLTYTCIYAYMRTYGHTRGDLHTLEIELSSCSLLLSLRILRAHFQLNFTARLAHA